jgi:hypothetical protein
VIETITPQALQTLRGVRAGAGLGGGKAWAVAAGASWCRALVLVFFGTEGAADPAEEALVTGAGPAAGSGAAGGAVAGVAASGVVAVDDGGALVWPQDWSTAAPKSRLAHSAGVLKRLDDKGMTVTLSE